MLLSIRQAGRIFAQHHASARADVTGFGLLGHLVEILKPSGRYAQLQLNKIPSIGGALDCLRRGIRSRQLPARFSTGEYTQAAIIGEIIAGDRMTDTASQSAALVELV